MTVGASDPATDPAKLVHGGGIVFLTKRAILRDLLDGYNLVSNNSAALRVASSKRVQATAGPLVGLNGGLRPDGLYFYMLVEDDPTKFPHHVSFLETRTANRAQGNAFDVPDGDLVTHRRLTFETVEQSPPGYPASAFMRRIGVEILSSLAPLRGSTVVEQVMLPSGQDDVPPKLISELEFSRDLRFKAPIPYLRDKPMIFKKFSSHFVTTEFGENVALLEDEQRIWPDGQVLQQVHVRDPQKGRESFKGTMILPDADRTPVNFERVVDHAAATASAITRNLAGFAIVANYGKGNVFTGGEIRQSTGRLLAQLSASGSAGVKIKFPDGTSESASIDDTAGIATGSLALP